MRPGTRRAVVGILSVSAVLLPAVGITYLGAVSYGSDRGVVAAKVDEQLRTAQAAARETEVRLEAAVLAAEALFARESTPSSLSLAALVREQPVARMPFRVASSGTLSWPRPDPLVSAAGIPESMALARGPRVCPEATFERCVRSIRESLRRARRLEKTREAELRACGVAGCRTEGRELAAVRRSYEYLSRFADTGPEALLGLARVHRHAGQRKRARRRYRELVERFEFRQGEEGVPYTLLGELGVASLDDDPRTLLEIYSRIVSGGYAGSMDALFAVATEVRSRLADADLDSAQADLLSVVDRALERVPAEVDFARFLTSELDDVVRDARAEVRGRPALDGSERTLLYRKTAAGEVVGLVVSNAAIGDVARRAAGPLYQVAGNARVEVRAVGRLPSKSTRTLATASFGAVLPHFGLSLVNDLQDPDPLDVIVDAQGKRHLWLSGGLALVLVFGIVATVRGAARERELARLKSDFVSTVSHELKTPLTSVRMFAEMLQQGLAGGDREREARYHEIIVKESERLGLLIANLLDYSQVERGTRRYSSERLSPANVVRDAVATFARFEEADGPEIAVVDECDESALVQIDREVLVQCVLNLLSNAAKYAGADKPITVSIVSAADGVTISVRDRGPGISRSEQGRIWDEFYRSPSAYSSGVEGTGLGLALVKRHIEAQGGDVRVEAAVGEGATFFLRLPQARQHNSEEAG